MTLIRDIPCEIEGCEKGQVGRGWCRRHYARWYANGHPTNPKPPTPWITPVASEVTIRRFNAKFEVQPGGCWLWIGSINARGYGNFTRPPRRFVSAHRFSYELLVGSIPEGLVLDHLCRVRNCVNPTHLEPVTFAENIRRGMSPSAIAARAKRERGAA